MVISSDAPGRGSSALLMGFRLYGNRLHLHQVPVIVQGGNKPRRIVAHDHKDTGLKKYNGLSGGPFLDNKNSAGLSDSLNDNLAPAQIIAGFLCQEEGSRFLCD